MNVDFLSGLRVLELGDGVAGASATGILAALGAEVTSVVSPTSSHRRGCPRVELADSAPALLGACLDRGKELLPVADIDASVLLARPYDVVVVDRVGGFNGPLGEVRSIEEYLGLVDRYNKEAWLTISAFGLSGPRASRYGDGALGRRSKRNARHRARRDDRPAAEAGRATVTPQHRSMRRPGRLPCHRPGR